MSSSTRNSNSTGKKKGGGFLARQAKAKGKSDGNFITEEELLNKEHVSPDDVLKLNYVTESKYIIIGYDCVLDRVDAYH